MKYSIWIIPPEPIFSQLKKIIGSLSKENTAPLFDPHMTLLGNIDEDLSEIESKIRKLLTNAGGLRLELGPISFSSTYFQSVFVRVNSTAQLMQLNLDIKKALNMENSVFMPHMSLLYGDHDMKSREEIASKIKLYRSSFDVRKVVIIPEMPNPKDWKPEVVIPIG